MKIGEFILLTGTDDEETWVKIDEIIAITDYKDHTTILLKDYETRADVKESPRHIVHIIDGSEI